MSEPPKEQPPRLRYLDSDGVNADPLALALSGEVQAEDQIAQTLLDAVRCSSSSTAER